MEKVNKMVIDASMKAVVEAGIKRINNKFNRQYNPILANNTNPSGLNS